MLRNVSSVSQHLITLRSMVDVSESVQVIRSGGANTLSYRLVTSILSQHKLTQNDELKGSFARQLVFTFVNFKA